MNSLQILQSSLMTQMHQKSRLILTGMGVIAMAKTEYGKSITGAELKACKTVEDVFNLVKNK